MTPKSLAEATGFHVATRNYMLRFCGSLFNIWVYEQVILTAPLGYAEKILFQLFNRCIQFYQRKRQE